MDKICFSIENCDKAKLIDRLESMYKTKGRRMKSAAVRTLVKMFLNTPEIYLSRLKDEIDSEYEYYLDKHKKSRIRKGGKKREKSV